MNLPGQPPRRGWRRTRTRRIRRHARAAGPPGPARAPPGKGPNDGAGPATSPRTLGAHPPPLNPVPARGRGPTAGWGGAPARRGSGLWRREGRPLPPRPPRSSGGTGAFPTTDRPARAGPGTRAPRPAAAATAAAAAGQPPRRVSSPTEEAPPRGAGWCGRVRRAREGGKEGNGHAEPSPRPRGPAATHRHRRRRRAARATDKPLCRGLTFNRSQRGSCSATYETPTQKQVVYEWFSTRFPTNVRCVTGEGAAAFPAAPRVPGRRALRTGPRSRRAAGRAAPRPGGRGRRPAGGDGGGPAIRGQPRLPRRCRIVPPGRDSDLEAFSHNPTDGSFAPLAPQPSTYTKCLNLRFLSY